jgi:hypothetical protein
MGWVQWFTGIMAWVSQGLNVIFLRGSQDMTVSARCHVLQDRPGWKQARRVINGLFFWQEDHCYSSFKSDLAYARWVCAISADRRGLTRSAWNSNGCECSRDQATESGEG